MPKQKLLYLHDGTSLYDIFFLTFLKENFDVTLATFSPEGAGRIREKLGIECVLLRDSSSVGPLRAVRRAWEVWKYKAGHSGFNVVLPCWATTYGFYAAVARMRPIGLVVWGSDVLVQPRSLPKRMLAVVAIRSSSKVFVDSVVQARAVERLGGRRGRIVKFPWVDIDWVFRRAPRRVRSMNDAPTIIFCRGHDAVYRPMTLVEAIPLIVGRHPSANVLIAGEGPLTPTMRNRVRQLGVEKNVTFLGQLGREELVDRMAGSDVYVSTSSSDGTSSSLLEAMALGVAPVVTAIPGNEEWVTDGRTGLLFPVDDSAALARSVNALLGDGALSSRISRDAADSVRVKSGWKRNSQDFLEAIRSMSEPAR